MRLRITSAVVCLALAQATLAHAEQATDMDPAAQLVDEARKLMEDGKYARACGMLEQSQKLDPQLGTQLHLGDCYEKLGQYAAAYRTFQAATEVAALRNQQGNNEPREKDARERASNLEAQLSLLELRPADAAADLTIALDGAPIERARWNRPFPIAHGDHVLRASAKGRIAWKQPFTIGVPAKRVIAVPALKLETSAQAQPVAPAAALVATERASAASFQRVSGFVALGSGAAALGLGALFGVMRTSKVTELAGDCDLDRGVCTIDPGDTVARQRIESLHKQASMFATSANIAWIAGGIAVAAGVVLILTTGREDRPALTLGITPGGLSFTARTHAL